MSHFVYEIFYQSSNARFPLYLCCYYLYLLFINSNFLILFYNSFQPQNLLLTQPFPNGDVKLCDFGISRVLTKGAEIREIVGTPDYVGTIYAIANINTNTNTNTNNALILILIQTIY